MRGLLKILLRPVATETLGGNTLNLGSRFLKLGCRVLERT